MSTPFKVKAIYEYASNHDDDLKFPVGQIITVTEVEDADWYVGEYIDELGGKQEGIFPRNFVEKYEPTAPPRPTRARAKKDAEPASGLALASPSGEPPEEAAPKFEPEAAADDDEEAVSPAQVSPPGAPVPKAAEPVPVASPPQPIPHVTEAATPASPPVPKAAPVQPKPGGPPPVSEKPAINSFRDRIAAFNKSAAPPIAPFKPGNLSSGSGGFIKKPFVAPPPSRNAFVPTARDVPVAKVYRRDEDPEVKEQEAENLGAAEKAGLVPGGASHEEVEEDQPKPLSLKERMALLQKQQVEQAQRHADAAAKKEKPKRPPKKRLESYDDTAEGGEASLPPPLERRNTEDTTGRSSMEEPHPPRMPHPPRRKSSRGLVAETQDGNEADMSGAGDTTEGQESELTEREDSDEKSRYTPKAAAGAPEEEDEDTGEEEGEGEEDDDVDPEVRRKEELRARMAKMSGGMGLHGIFGPPAMMPMPGAPPAPPKKKKTMTASDRRPSEPSEDAPPSASAPPIPTMMALPGMSTRRPEDKTSVQEEASVLDDEDDQEEAEEDEDEPAGPPPRTPSRKYGRILVMDSLLTFLKYHLEAPLDRPRSRQEDPPRLLSQRKVRLGIESIFGLDGALLTLFQRGGHRRYLLRSR